MITSSPAPAPTKLPKPPCPITAAVTSVIYPITLNSYPDFANHFCLGRSSAPTIVGKAATGDLCTLPIVGKHTSASLKGDSLKMVKKFLEKHFLYVKNGKKITLLGRNYEEVGKPNPNTKEHTHLASLLLLNDALATCDNYETYIDNFGKVVTIGKNISTIYYRRSFLNILCGQISETFYNSCDEHSKVLALCTEYHGIEETYEAYRREILRISYNNITNTLNYITNKHIMVQNKTYLLRREGKWDVSTLEECVLMSGCIGKALITFEIPNSYALFSAPRDYKSTYWHWIVTEFNKINKENAPIRSVSEVLGFSFRNDQLAAMYQHYMLTVSKRLNITHELLTKNREYLITKILRDFEEMARNMPESVIQSFKIKEKYNCVSELTTELILPNYY